MRTRSLGPKPQLHRRQHRFDGGDASVGRSDDQALAQRRHAVGIAEEIGDPQRDDDEQPGERRPQQEEEQRQPIAMAMNLWPSR